MDRSTVKPNIGGRGRWKSKFKWLNIISFLNRVRKGCRIFSLSVIAIAYASTYFFLSSNSEFMIPQGDVSYVDRYNGNETVSESILESHISEIRRRANWMSRVYEPSHPSTWCVDNKKKLDQRPHEPMGLCYLRIPRSAGATLKGINMRISRKFGQRHDMESCIRHDSNVKGEEYAKRHYQSYLWTFIRDPTHRAMSVIGSKLSNKLLRSNYLDNKSLTDSDKNILVTKTLYMLKNDSDIKNGIFSKGRGGFQLQYVSQGNVGDNYVYDPLNLTKISNPVELTRKISNTFQKYDFVGLVERFDESLVVMQLLLGLESSDILHFAVNRKEQWRRARVNRTKFVCRNSFDWEVDLVTEPLIRNYLLESEEWYAQNYADYLFYQAAHQSLDRTILKIGLPYFSKELRKFRDLVKRANEECSPIFLCSLNGTYQFDEAQHDCLTDGNIGCGYRCLDGLTN